MKHLNASKGLGDALYLRAVVLHLLKRGEKVAVVTGWPDLFSDLPVAISPATADEDMHHAKPCLHCRIITDMDAFSMACQQAGITEPVELRVDWAVRNTRLVDEVKQAARERKILVYQPPKKPCNENQALTSPKREAFVRCLEEFDGFRVKLGHSNLDNCGPADLDLFGKTSVTDAIDVCTAADLFFGEPCYLFILAQALNKPSVSMFSGRAADSGRHRLVNFSPKRLFHKRELTSAIYDDGRCAS